MVQSLLVTNPIILASRGWLYSQKSLVPRKGKGTISRETLFMERSLGLKIGSILLHS